MSIISDTFCCPHCGKPLSTDSPVTDKTGRVVLKPGGRLFVDGQMKAKLTPQESIYCRLLLLAKGRVVKKTAFYDSAFGPYPVDSLPEMSITSVVLCHLRRKLQPTPLQIINDWGVGWLMETFEEELTP